MLLRVAHALEEASGTLGPDAAGHWAAGGPRRLKGTRRARTNCAASACTLGAMLMFGLMDAASKYLGALSDGADRLAALRVHHPHGPAPGARAQGNQCATCAPPRPGSRSSAPPARHRDRPGGLVLRPHAAGRRPQPPGAHPARGHRALRAVAQRAGRPAALGRGRDGLHRRSDHPPARAWRAPARRSWGLLGVAALLDLPGPDPDRRAGRRGRDQLLWQLVVGAAVLELRRPFRLADAGAGVLAFVPRSWRPWAVSATSA